MEAPGFALAVALFAVGLATSPHCVGMCGGIVTAFASRGAAPPLREMRDMRQRASEWPRQLAFSGGRIASYALAGAAAGLLGSAGAWSVTARAPQTLLATLANLVLILVGLNLASGGRVFAFFEPLGARVWRLISPHAARLGAAESLPGAVAAGMLWGWLPCGFVYAALSTAVFAGGPLEGAVAMTAFGLGTLPGLLAAGLAALQLRRFFDRPMARAIGGTLILGFGIAGLARAGGIAQSVQDVLLCF